MKSEKSARLQIKVEFSDQGEVPALQAYAFNRQGAALGQAPLKDGAAVIELPAEMDGQMVELILGPPTEKGQPVPTAAALKRMGGYAKSTRLLLDKPVLQLKLPTYIFPHWCLCYVRGRLVKRFNLPDGSARELPVCHARVHVCEVDRIRLVIEKLPDPEILRLRDDLLHKLQLRPLPFPPIPDPGPLAGPIMTRSAARPAAAESPLPQAPASTDAETLALHAAALTAAQSAGQARRQLLGLASIIAIHLCDLTYLWGYFRVDALTTIDADSDGRFAALIFHDCADQPDLYFWVEQFQGGVWTTVYRPSIGCGTHWNYPCGSEVVINLPGAVACEEPPYDVPPGVTLFMLPYAIANAPIWGIPPGAPAAPAGWVRPDGMLDYQTGTSLGWLYNAPFGGTLNFIHDDSYFIPSSGIKYYRYAYRRLSGTPNTGAADPSWTPISASLARGYRMEYSDRLPTYQSYSVGPFTPGPHSSLFKFKPQTPPTLDTDPTTVVTREWISGNLSEVAASWNTLLAAPPLSTGNVIDDAGVFEVKIEVFDSDGNQVMPGAGSFRFLARNADGSTTRLSTAAEEAGGAYVLRVHVDNNYVSATLPQPSIGGVAASDDCGFLRYHAGDLVHVQYQAAHPNQHAVFAFGIKRGSNTLASATTLAPYVEVAAVSAPTTTTPYIKVAGSYQRDFSPAELAGTCVNAAFAASLGVYRKVTDGYQRLGPDAPALIAFALAERGVVAHP
ncbi:Transglutaminase-like domain-containing protein [Rhodanobacter sp. Root179]|uniref:hypothetical protein n=1 Tax=Rhodanobacter sp. Root179 TaxID=1736482 RepID=UPI0006FDA2D9|nr:hypothetical protein [Rhodanobacter sp. Root179]KRB37416.1 hypothetical protein ASD82_12275 [Rhodanobacter sp. Root179]